MNIKKFLVGGAAGALMLGATIIPAFAACSTVNTSKGSMTAAVVDPGAQTTGVDATGCQIGVYFDQNGSVSGADISGATYYGVFVDGIRNDVSVDISDSDIHNIGENPFNGAQHGNAIYYYGYQTTGTVTGTVSDNIVENYQKGGIIVNGEKSTVSVNDNIVTGLGPFKNIAQNGIQFGFGGTALSVIGNTVSGNIYTQGGDPGWVSTGILFFQGNYDGLNANQILPTVQRNNKVFRNQANVTVIQ